MRRVIAIDFDGVLCADAWPEIGEERSFLIRAAKKEQEAGAALILWTCRTGADLEAAVSWCAARGLCFDAVNENLPERIARYGNDCRKVSADEYWDDRAQTPLDLWLKHTESLSDLVSVLGVESAEAFFRYEDTGRLYDDGK